MICIQFSFFPELLCSGLTELKFIFLTVGLCLLSLFILFHKKTANKIYYVFVGLLFFSIFHGISYLWAIHPSLVWNNFVSWSTVALIFLIASSLPKRIINDKDFSYLFIIIIITNILHLYFSIFAVIYKNGYSFESDMMRQVARNYGMWSSNYLSSLILLYIPVLLELKKTTIQLRKLCIVAICSIIILIPFFNSRATTIVLILMLIFYVLVGEFKLGSILTTSLKKIVFAGALFVFLFSFIENKKHFIKSHNPLISFLDDRKEERLDIWKNTYSLIKERPLLGHGSGNWVTEVYKYGYDDYDNGMIYAQAHNFWIQTISEIGIFGAFIFLFIVATIIYYGFYQKEWNAVAGFFIWLMCSSFYALYISKNGIFLPHIYLSFIFCGYMFNQNRKFK